MPAAIERLKTTLGRQTATMLPMLIENFFKELAMFQEQAQQVLETGHADELRRIAHTLKSNASNFGATSLAELCRQLETRAKEGKLNGCEDVLAAVKREYEPVRAALQMLLEEHL